MNYDFIEIGSSDIETLLESRSNSIGLTVEPLECYLNNLPNVPGVEKVPYAIGDYNGTVEIFFVHPDNIEKYQLPPWLRGCNSIGQPHITTQKLLQELQLYHLLESKIVVQLTWDRLVELYNVESVEYVKIDAEGFDTIIVNNMLHSTHNVLPKVLSFECNVMLTHKTIIDYTIDRLVYFGYKEGPRFDDKEIDDGDRFFYRSY